MKLFHSLLAAGAFLLLVLDGKASVYVGFEPEEGFTPNARVNTAGWSISNDPRIRVTNGSEPVHSGSYSLYTQGISNTSNVTAIHNSLADPAEGLDTFTIYFTNEIAGFVAHSNKAWVYIRLWDEASQSLQSVRLLVRYGATESDPYVIGYNRYNSGTGEFSQVLASLPQTAINFSEWNSFTALFDFENKSYTFRLNDIVIAADIPLPASWNVTGIVGTWLISGGDPGTITYYDDLMITKSIPEPSAWALLGLAGLGTVVWRRRIIR